MTETSYIISQHLSSFRETVTARSRKRRSICLSDKNVKVASPKMESDAVFNDQQLPTFNPRHRVMSRKDSVMATPGKEGSSLAPGSCSGKCIGVFTSGGDSQGRSRYEVHLTSIVFNMELNWRQRVLIWNIWRTDVCDRRCHWKE